jgi:hypothetical protein
METRALVKHTYVRPEDSHFQSDPWIEYLTPSRIHPTGVIGR